MDLKELQKHWNEFGKRDPLWAILSSPQKRNRRWELAEFFKTGEDEIAQVMASVDQQGIARPTKRALDFGCGVGRLTQALCGYFDQCCGVDIAETMIDLARKYNRHGAKCQYFLNDRDDLAIFETGSFDFIYSNIVLQHISPEYSRNYIKEFMRILEPGGLLIFQIPSHPKVMASATDVAAASSLPADAFLAQISIDRSTIVTQPNQTLVLTAVVKNNSPEHWPSQRMAQAVHALKLANHWLDRHGNVVSLDDGRTLIEQDVPPGGSVSVPLTINTPPQAGSYILELDLVQELIAWFGNKGSPTLRIPVQVREQFSLYDRLFRRARPAQANDEGIIPHMEMHGIPQADIYSLVEAHNGRVIGSRENSAAGDDWVGFCYYVTKLC